MTDETTGPANEATDTAADEHGAPPAAESEAIDGGGEEPQHLGARARRRAARLAGTGETAARPDGESRPRRPPAAPSTAGGSTEAPRLEYAEAEHIDVQRGSIGSAMARSIALQQGALGRAQAEQVTVTLGALGGARATHVVVEKGVLGGAIAGDVRVRQGLVQGLIARDVSIEQGGARSIIANHVTLGRHSGALIAIARTIDGEGRVIVDWRGGLALGVAFAVVSALLRARLPRR